MLRIWSPNSFVFWTNQFYTRLWLYHVSETICSLSFWNTTRSYVQCHTRKLHRGVGWMFSILFPNMTSARRLLSIGIASRNLTNRKKTKKFHTNIWNNVFQLESFLQIDWFISCVEWNLRFCWEPPVLYYIYINKSKNFQFQFFWKCSEPWNLWFWGFF